MIEHYLRELCSTPGEERPALIASWLPRAVEHKHRMKRRMRWTSEGSVMERPVARNIILETDAPRLILGAHHDIDPGTTEGATDNAAAVALLVHVALELEAEGAGRDVEICFWDYEEPGNGGFADGSRFYAGQLEKRAVAPELVLVLDALGYGQSIVSLRGPDCSRLQAALARHGEEPPLVHTPASDDISFYQKFPTALLASWSPTEQSRAWGIMHSSYDTFDKVDIDSLYTLAHQLKGIVRDLDLAIEDAPWRRPLPKVDTDIRPRRRAAKRKPRAGDDSRQRKLDL